MTPAPGAITRRHVILGIIVAGILVLTMTPEPGQVAMRCIVCGDEASADFLRNIVFFMPLGAALAYAGWPRRRAIAAAALFSIVIELAQLLVPGRSSSVSDMLTNTAGAALGFLLVAHAPALLAPAPARARRLALIAAAAALTVAALTRVLLRPAYPPGMYFGQWAPVLSHLAPYGGTVEDVTLGGRPVADGMLTLPGTQIPDRAPRAALIAGETLRIRARAGPATPRLAPIFSIADSHAREIILVGADRGDLVLRYRTRGVALRFDQPDLRVAGALGSAAAGAPLEIVVERPGPRPCLTINGRRACPSLGALDGWAFIANPEWMTDALRWTAGIVWLVLLVLPAAYWAARLRPRAR